MKKISVAVPCYNEAENIGEAYNKLTEVLRSLASEYDYEIVIEDNNSTDGTQDIIREIATKDSKVKVIFNMKNFGPDRSFKNAMYSCTGDVIISFPADMQEPAEMIPEFVKLWAQGNLLVWGKKIESQESRIKWWLRTIYYKIIKTFSDTQQMEHVTGFGAYDRSVVEMLKSLNEPLMAERNIIMELGYPITIIPYKQNKREHGKSHYGITGYFDFAIRGLIRTSIAPLHIAVALGALCSGISFAIGIVYLIYKLMYWYTFEAGQAPLVIAVFFLGGLLLLFLGIIGEYVGVILEKVTKRPLVVERERLNF